MLLNFLLTRLLDVWFFELRLTSSRRGFTELYIPAFTLQFWVQRKSFLPTLWYAVIDLFFFCQEINGCVEFQYYFWHLNRPFLLKATCVGTYQLLIINLKAGNWIGFDLKMNVIYWQNLTCKQQRNADYYTYGSSSEFIKLKKNKKKKRKPNKSRTIAK